MYEMAVAAELYGDVWMESALAACAVCRFVSSNDRVYSLPAVAVPTEFTIKILLSLFQEPVPFRIPSVENIGRDRFVAVDAPDSPRSVIAVAVVQEVSNGDVVLNTTVIVFGLQGYGVLWLAVAERTTGRKFSGRASPLAILSWLLLLSKIVLNLANAEMAGS